MSEPAEHERADRAATPGARGETELALPLPPEFLERIVEFVTPIVRDRLAAEQAEPSPYFTVAEAADFARCKPQRIRDLLRPGPARRLTPVKEGGRTLVLRDELRAYIAGEPFPPRSPRARRSRAARGFQR